MPDDGKTLASDKVPLGITASFETASLNKTPPPTTYPKSAKSITKLAQHIL